MRYEPQIRAGVPRTASQVAPLGSTRWPPRQRRRSRRCRRWVQVVGFAWCLQCGCGQGRAGRERAGTVTFVTGPKTRCGQGRAAIETGAVSNAFGRGSLGERTGSGKPKKGKAPGKAPARGLCRVMPALRGCDGAGIPTRCLGCSCLLRRIASDPPPLRGVGRHRSPKV